MSPAESMVNGVPIQEHLEAIERRLSELAQRLPVRVDSTASGQESAAIQSTLAGLDKQVNRMGREQLKANALIEAQMEQLTAALEALRIADARREAELVALREQNRATQSTARLDVVQAILPALDGLDEALRAGQHLLNQVKPSPPPAILERLRLWQPQREVGAQRETLAAWLVGITFVRQRLLDVLAAEGVQPIAAHGQPFDPTRHIAIEVVPASDDLPPGIVAAELRRGYLVHDHVLRHAEVAVCK